MDFQVWDFPGQLEYLEPSFDLEDIFGSLGALVWVIDAQDDYLDAVSRLNRTILIVHQYYPHINIEVFIHKVDGLSDEYRSDTFQDIVQRISDELSDAGYENPPVHYYLTSIYDYSVFEAFSKVIQKLIPQLSTLENLINILANNSGMEKTYLFDVLSKIYIASDTRPVDMECYEMCSDYIDVIVDVSELYSWDHPERKARGSQISEAESHVILHDKTMIHLMEMNKCVSPLCFFLGFGFGCGSSCILFFFPTSISVSRSEVNPVSRYLCLVSVIKNPDAKDKKGLIDMNCRIFQDALNEVFSRKWEQE
jgi:Ras-related GTP-binding protein C/D